MSVEREVPTAPTTLQRWFPIAEWLPRYDWRRSLRVDLVAALAVGASFIPQSLGLATVAGVPPVVGLYAAPIALVAYAAFGGSKLLIVGATGSMAAVSADVVADAGTGEPGEQLAMTAAFALATGAVFLLAGLARMGWVANFVSSAVMAGLILGLSVQIIVNQLGDIFGIEPTGDNTVEKLWAVVSDAGNWDATATALGLGSLLLMFALSRLAPGVPGPLIAAVAASALVAAVGPDIELVDRISRGLPTPEIPNEPNVDQWGTLLLGAGIAALVGITEGKGALVTIRPGSVDDLDTDQELRALGASNVGAGLLGGMVVTGSLGKSAGARAAGATSQVAGLLLAGLVVLTLVVIAPAFQWLPRTVLAAIVVHALLDPANPRRVHGLWRVDRVDYAFAATTFALVLVVDLFTAMLGGVVLSVLYTLYRVSFPGRAVLGRLPDTDDYVAMRWIYGRRHGEANPQAKPVPGIVVYRFASPLIFSNGEAFVEGGRSALIGAAGRESLPHTLVVDFQEVYRVDTTGALAMQSLAEFAARYDVDVRLARVHSGPRELLSLTGVVATIGDDHLHRSIREAVAAARAAREASDRGDDPPAT